MAHIMPPSFAVLMEDENRVIERSAELLNSEANTGHLVKDARKFEEFYSSASFS